MWMIEEFWREAFPYFTGKFELFYVYMNIVTIIVFLRVVTFFPSLAIGVKTKLW